MAHSPEEIVNSYIQAYFDWNNRSDARTNLVVGDEEKYGRSMKVATDEYQQILNRLCVKSTVTYSTNFGNNPLHDPKSETIESVDIQGTTALVRTRDIRKFGPLVSYEYHLVQEDGQWRICKLLYVDDISADDCL
jgi:hypothetical protein